MRFAIISDVHGNLESLRTAFALLENDDRLLCLGDMVGYGPNPNECVEMIRNRSYATVLGNHDVAAIDNFGIEYFNPAARAAIEWTQTVINDGVKEWLNGLSYEVRVPEYLMVHGAPVNYFEYIMDKRGAQRAFSNTDAPIIFVGHSHIAEYYKLESDGSIAHAHMQHGGDLWIDPKARYLINVGSVGQPRDLNPEAAFVFYDDVTRVVEWVRYPYAIAEVQQKIHACHLPETLATRLDSGR